MKNLVAVKVSPRIIRNKATARVIPAQVIVTPSVRRKSISKAIAKSAPKQVPNQAIRKKSITINLPQRQKQQLKKKRREPKVTYTTKDTTPESLVKIKALHNSKTGRILLIVGNGPSINSIPLEQLRGHPLLDTLSINKPDSRIWPTTCWTFFDQSQMKRHRDLWNGYTGYIFNSTAIRDQCKTSMQFKYLSTVGWSRDLTAGVHICRTSVYASMQIAAWMGYDYVYIIGVDMDPAGIDGKLHFYGENPDVSPDRRGKRFEKEAVAYDHAASVLSPEERKRFIFCTKGINPWPFMNKFPTLEPREVVGHIMEHKCAST